MPNSTTSAKQGQRAAPRQARRSTDKADTPLRQLLHALGYTGVEKFTRALAADGIDVSTGYLTRVVAGTAEPSLELARELVRWSRRQNLPVGVESLRLADLVDTGEE